MHTNSQFIISVVSTHGKMKLAVISILVTVDIVARYNFGRQSAVGSEQQTSEYRPPEEHRPIDQQLVTDIYLFQRTASGG